MGCCGVTRWAARLWAQVKEPMMGAVVGISEPMIRSRDCQLTDETDRQRYCTEQADRAVER